jgi:amino acid transporter/mannitol/fructose-specific phosphotransferase system IIA component (Ntr-type)
MTQQRLHKHLRFPSVFAFSIGPMLASGVFMLPAFVYTEVGPAAILAYLIAGLLLIPALLSQAELATAMPRAGGTYYYLDRSLGPLVGTVSGAGTWLALVFKSAFDLIGLGAYLVIFLNLPVRPVAVALCVLFAGLSISGVKNVARLQITLVTVVLSLIAYFLVQSSSGIDPGYYQPFFRGDAGHFLGAIGLVYVGFTGLTKVASVAEEVEDLDRTIPRAMIYALMTTIVIYVIAMFVMVGVIDGSSLSGTLTPVADAARETLGPFGSKIMAAAAIIAFIASANAGLTAASRYPLAMGRDHMVPAVFSRLGRFHTPTNAILLTSGLMMFFIVVLSPTGIAKLASAFQLLLFGLINLSVIVMRESQIASYDPGFRSRGYPWVQVIGILASLILIPQLGFLSVAVSGSMIALTILWYITYARDRVDRGSALYHLFERMGRGASPQLDQELRQILTEKGMRREDSFERSIVRAGVLLHQEGESFHEVVEEAARILSDRVDISLDELETALSETTRLGYTPIGDHVALPHARLDSIHEHELVIVHSRKGLNIEGSDEIIYAVLILVGPKEDPGRHLRFLADLANRADAIDFTGEWRLFNEADQIRACFIRSGEVAEVTFGNRELAGLRIRDVNMHERCLIAFMTREENMIVPHGDTILEIGDHLTLVGEAEAVVQMRHLFAEGIG